MKVIQLVYRSTNLSKKILSCIFPILNMAAFSKFKLLFSSKQPKAKQRDNRNAESLL